MAGEQQVQGLAEPWNPFDTNSEKDAFPDLELALKAGADACLAAGQESTDGGGGDGHRAADADIDGIALAAPAEIDADRPLQLGWLPSDASAALHGACQAWFDARAELKRQAVRALACWASTSSTGTGCCLFPSVIPRHPARPPCRVTHPRPAARMRCRGCHPHTQVTTTVVVRAAQSVVLLALVLRLLLGLLLL